MADSNKGWMRRSAEYLGFTAAPEAAPTQVRESSVTTAPARPTTSAVTVDAALSIAAVYRSVSILQTAAEQMELGTYRKGREVTSPAIVRTPNVNDTQGGFVQETVFSLACHGEAFWRLYRSSAADAVASIKVCAPEDVSYTEDVDSGKVTYYHLGKQLQPYQIKHLKLMRRPGKVNGLGPIQAARGEIASALRLREFADTWFDSSGVPIGYLTTDMVLGPDESQEFATAWKKFLAENGGIGVLSNGLNYKHLALKPADAQFLEVQQAVVVNIARLFGIPTTYLLAEMQGSSSTYVNQQEINLIFLQMTLTRYLREIEENLTTLIPRGQKVRFKEDQLLRMNSKLKTEIEALQVEWGLRSAEELRAKDNLDPLPANAHPVKEAPAGDEA